VQKIIFVSMIVGSLVLCGFISSAINKTPDKHPGSTVTLRPTSTPEPSPQKQQEVTPTPEINTSLVETRRNILGTYIKALDDIGMNQFLVSVTYKYRSTDECSIVIVVRDTWHYQHKQLRLQAAQNLWKLWSQSYDLEDKKDTCRMDLVDGNGNVVGGSSWMGGSVVNVKD
jgi:hypothetical protein